MKRGRPACTPDKAKSKTVLRVPAHFACLNLAAMVAYYHQRVKGESDLNILLLGLIK